MIILYSPEFRCGVGKVAPVLQHDFFWLLRLGAGPAVSLVGWGGMADTRPRGALICPGQHQRLLGLGKGDTEGKSLNSATGEEYDGAGPEKTGRPSRP